MTVMGGVGAYSYAKTHYPPPSSKAQANVELGPVASIARSTSDSSFFNEHRKIKLNTILGETNGKAGSKAEERGASNFNNASDIEQSVGYIHMASQDNSNTEEKVLLV